MPSPFPGMDPYLEDPQLWRGFHQRLIVYLADFLGPNLQPRYITAVEERVFVEGPDREIIPDVWMRSRKNVQPPSSDSGGVAVLDAEAPEVVEVPPLEVAEAYLAILDRQSGQKVVTVIEVVSPTNKYEGPGRRSYLAKQKEVLSSDVHLVEIDLLRTGPHVLAVPEYAARSRGPYDQLLCVNRCAGMRARYELYPRRLRQPLPRIGIPLAEPDPDVVLDLQAVFAHTYDAGSYGQRIVYTQPCRPPLAPEDQAWAEELVRGRTTW